MKLLKLEIERKRWGIDTGKMLGEIEFENQSAKVSIKLNEDQAYKMLEIVADAMIVQAKEVSQMLVSDLQRPQASIEGEIQ